MFTKIFDATGPLDTHPVRSTMSSEALHAAFTETGTTDPDERARITEAILAFCDTQRRLYTERASHSTGPVRIMNLLRADGFNVAIYNIDREKAYE